MPSEVWGYRVGDAVEVQSPVDGSWTPGTVTRIDNARNVWVGAVCVRLPNRIRRFIAPTDLWEVEEFLQG